jgi:hypothetical protein
MADKESHPPIRPEGLIEEGRSITTSLLTDAAIVVGPTVAVVTNHLLNKPKDTPPPEEPPKKG